jgi:hypothetical protein
MTYLQIRGVKIHIPSLQNVFCGAHYTCQPKITLHYKNHKNGTETILYELDEYRECDKDVRTIKELLHRQQKKDNEDSFKSLR